MGIEIEKKFTVKELPADLDKYPFHTIEQGYLNVHPAIRVRREDETYYMTYKGVSTNADGIGKVEYNLPLDKDSYDHLIEKSDGNIIRKKRYCIPINKDAFAESFLSENSETAKALSQGDIKIELDIFAAPFEGRILAEVEFPSEEAAAAYIPAPWFDEDVTGDLKYSNSVMSKEEI